MKLNRITAQLAASALMLPLSVYAAGLGRLTVNSALGQPLSAEIELLAVDKAELDSLNASLASGQAFKDAQIEYAPALSTLQFKVDRRADGRPVLKVTSTRPINDPFLDMLIELNWASGRLVREYTVLLDPPGIATPQIVAPLPVAAPVVQTPKAIAPAASEGPLPVAKPAAAVPSEARQPAEPKEMAAEARPIEKEAAPVTRVVRVKPGDTLAAIAGRVKPANISLDQALVSLFKENEHAFDGQNMNRLKAGKTLTIPSAEAMAQVDAQTASREVRLQASDWQAYRMSLAERVAALPVKEPAKEGGQVSAGKITPKVEDKAKPVEEGKDVLKLSKAAVPPVAAATAPGKEAETAKQAAAKEAAMEEKIKAQEEDLIAREKALKESSERVATLEKQIRDMQDLVQMKEKAQQGAAKPPAPAPTIEAKPPVETPQASLLEQILANPVYWGGGLAALGLGGALWWMMTGSRRRKANSLQTEDSHMSSQTLMTASPIKTTSGGGIVDTGNSSFLTDFSQVGLGTIDTQDVDPIAEAEVYMAYGRDAQAEEILKEALNKTPDRHEIRIKLLEIYAARKNTVAFESVARDLHDALGDRQSQLWERAAELGRSIDPENPLYDESGGRKAEGAGVSTPEAGAIVTGAMGAAAATMADKAVAEVQENTQHTQALGSTMPAREATPGVLDFETQVPDVNAPAVESTLPEINLDREAHRDQDAASAASTGSDFDQGLEFDLSGLDIKVPEEEDTDFSLDEVDALSADGKMDFSGLDLNLDEVGGDDSMDEVATKLDLARAYLEMGDKEGAREILQEVINEGNEKQQSDARSMMAAL